MIAFPFFYCLYPKRKTMLSLFPFRSLSICFLLLIISCCYACRQNGQAEQSSSGGQVSAPYPSIPDSTMQRLWDECDYIDFVFYNLSFSMSQEQQSDIRSTLQHISRKPAEVYPECPAMGRLFFQIEGENAAQADIFFTPECQYFVFYEDNEKTYANAMTPAGIQFYERVLQMIEQ